MASFPSAESCPCGVSLSYANHCQKHHDIGYAGLAATAEETMRSRYSAYVVEGEAYLLATWHKSTRPVAVNFEGVEWHGLTVIETSGGAGLNNEGTVEFTARFRRGDALLELHERSSFVREAGRWFYVDGDDPGSPS